MTIKQTEAGSWTARQHHNGVIVTRSHASLARAASDVNRYIAAVRRRENGNV